MSDFIATMNTLAISSLMYSLLPTLMSSCKRVLIRVFDLIIRMFRLKRYIIDGSAQPNMRKLIAFLKDRGDFGTNGEGVNNIQGWVYGWWYIGYIHTVFAEHPIYNVTIVISPKIFYDPLLGRSDTITVVDVLAMTWCHTNTSRIVYTHTARPHQTKVITAIKKALLDTGVVVVLLEGSVGCGKSEIPMLLCHEMNGTLIPAFDLLSSKTALFDMIINTIDHSITNPLVIALDEWDEDLAQSEKISNTGTQVYDSMIGKSKITKFMDNIHFRHLKSGVVVMLSMNDRNRIVGAGSESGFYSDPAYSRMGRITFRAKFNDETNDFDIRHEWDDTIKVDRTQPQIQLCGDWLLT